MEWYNPIPVKEPIAPSPTSKLRRLKDFFVLFEKGVIEQILENEKNWILYKKTLYH